MSDMMLDVDQAGELKAAFRRSDWTNRQIKQLCESNLLGDLRKVLEGSAEIVVKTVSEVMEEVKNLLTIIKTVVLEETGNKKTSECFTDKNRYAYRDPNLDSWLPKVQSGDTKCTATSHQLERGATFIDMAQDLLRNLLQTEERDPKTLSVALIANGKLFALPQIEALIERQEKGEDVGLRTDGWGNFFLVKDKNGQVCVVNVPRYGSRWDVFVRRLGHGDVWRAGARFFSRN